MAKFRQVFYVLGFSLGAFLLFIKLQDSNPGDVTQFRRELEKLEFREAHNLDRKLSQDNAAKPLKYVPDSDSKIHSKGDESEDKTDEIINTNTRHGRRRPSRQQVEQQEEEENLEALMSMKSNTSYKLIILTYMRSGSTLTGDLFQQHPEAFYLFEPLWRLQKLYSTNQEVHFFRKPVIRPKFGLDEFMSPDSHVSSHIQDILNCDFISVDIGTLMQGHMVTSKDTLPLKYCLMKDRGLDGLKRCLPWLYRPCKAAKVTTVKVIRMTMEQASFLLRSDPMVRIIHLIRDPRGMFKSQRSVGEFRWEDLREHAINRCGRIMKDLKLSMTLTSKYPGRILTVRYEDIAEAPQQAAAQIYKFVGLEMTETLKTYIYNHTYAGKPNDCNICTTRSNSSSTAFSWRTALPWDKINTIDLICKDIYKLIGYRTYKDGEDVKSSPMSPKLPTFNKLFETLDLIDKKGSR